MRRIVAVLVVGLLGLYGTGCINVEAFGPGEMRMVVVEESPRWFETNRVAIVDLEGVIGRDSDFWLRQMGTSVADVKEKLQRARRDPGVRAVVLRINSPGGSVSASDTIYREILTFGEESGKPVVAALNGTAASGGYYVALAADEIVASPTCVTGSVGVLIQMLNVRGLFDKLGLRSVIVKTGDKKDMGNPTRALTDAESAILQDVAESLFAQFVEAIHERRPAVSAATMDRISDGRILTAGQAHRMGLVDRVGYLEDALERAKELAGIQSADVVLYSPFRHYNNNIYAGSATPGEPQLRWDALLRGGEPRFMYLWLPGL